jgi:hypothetical protein
LQLKTSRSQKPAKNPMQKLPKNPTKNPQKSCTQKSFMIFLTKNLLKTLNISKNFLILHLTQTKQKTMHELITLTYPMKCGITGTTIDKGEQAYYNHQTKTCIHPLEYERNMSQVKIGDPKTYFTRLQKLNK